MNKDILRFVTIGSVDDGKSTLIGRLLYETNCVFIDQYEAIKKTSYKKGFDNPDLSLITDGLKSEREQGITIDVAYRYFSTDKRKFIVADCPGHVQYTKNMVTGASNSELSIVLIDAKNGITKQSKRHAFVTSLLQLNHMVVAVNKMDLVDFSGEVFNSLVGEYKEFLEKLNIKDVVFIPVSALEGDNIVKQSNRMEWYSGSTVLDYLENVYVGNNYDRTKFRMPIQNTLRYEDGFRGYAGKISSGIIRTGDEVVCLPSMKKSKIKSILDCNDELIEALDLNVVLTLEDDIDVDRGDMIVRTANIPYINNSIVAMMCWLDKTPMDINKKYILKHTNKTTKAVVSDFKYVIDVDTLHRSKKEVMEENDIGKVHIKTFDKLFFDPYEINKITGSFILIDPDDFGTVAAGFIRYGENEKNIRWEDSCITKADRIKRNGHDGKIVWMTGFSGSGKTTIAKEVEKKLFNTNHQVILLDGDNLRHGLCSDLDFSVEDRNENIRRIGEVAKLLVDTGFIVVCTFISSMKEQRYFVRSLVGEDEFVEIYIKCPIEICEKRDVKGLYKKFRDGEIPNLTGLGSPYEEPVNAELILYTNKLDIEECVKKVIDII